MQIKRRFTTEPQILSMLHTHSMLVESMSQKITSWFPSFPREYIVVCIGTDRSTGDALGPLVGTRLAEMNPKHMTVYGSLHKPVHAQNLDEYIKVINTNHRNPYIIAIDACLGRSSSVGKIITGTGPLKPGAALNKDLPAIGDIHITGVVNISGFMEYTILQNTRLSIVVDMADRIASILHIIDQQLTYQQTQPAIILPELRDVAACDHVY